MAIKHFIFGAKASDSKVLSQSRERWN